MNIQPELSLLGYALDADMRGTPVDEKTVCELAEDIRRGILCRIATLQLDPNKAVEIDGERWDQPGLIQSLKDLYEWTYLICGLQDQAAAVSSLPGYCKPRYCF
jgi:hypothetical protein